MLASEAPEWRSTLVKLSCNTRNRAISTLFGKRAREFAISAFMFIPLRLANPSINHSAAQANPTSSNNGGCSRYDMVRIFFQRLIRQVGNVGRSASLAVLPWQSS